MGLAGPKAKRSGKLMDVYQHNTTCFSWMPGRGEKIYRSRHLSLERLQSLRADSSDINTKIRESIYSSLKRIDSQQFLVY